MFTYLRYFILISGIAIIAAAVAFGIYSRSIAAENLQSVSQNSNIALLQAFKSTVWVKHRETIYRLQTLDVREWAKYPQYQTFVQDARRFFHKTPGGQVNIYNTKKRSFFTISSDSILKVNNKSVPVNAFDLALNGKTASYMLEDSILRSERGDTISGTLIKTVMPLVMVANLDPSKNVEAVVEVLYDVTPYWNDLLHFQWFSTGAIIVIFILLSITLLFISKRAENIIAKQHEANLELAAAAAAAEAQSRDKSQFLANVSHELRTPLNAIIGFSEIIKTEMMGAFENTKYQDYINDIHGSGVHLLSLINDILDYSKAEAGKLELDVSEIDATKIVINSMRLVQTRAMEAGVNLTQDVPKQHMVIKSDAKKLKQVLLNLLSNAVKFTPSGGEVSVSAWHNVVEDTISIQVKDTGIGIAPKDISRAMSPFGQVDNTLSRKFEGTGLGLPLTKKFVEIMGGEFNIHSELNVGTTITFTLPIGDPRERR